MGNEIIKIEEVRNFGIEETKAAQIKATFDKVSVGLVILEENFNQIISESETEITETLCKKAKRLRLDIAKIRIDAEKVRKSEKEEYLRAGKAIDGVANIIKWAVTQKEEKLEAIEKHYENLEKERLLKLQNQRISEIEMYLENANEINLAEMAEDVWQAYLATKKKNYEDKIAAEKKAELEKLEKERKEKLSADRKFLTSRLIDFIPDYDNIEFGDISEEIFKEIVENAKTKRAEYEAEQARIKAENERLKKEKAENERLAEIERKRQAEILRQKEEEAEEKRIAAKKKADEEKAELQKKLDEEKAENERLAEIERKRQAEILRQKEEEAEEKERLLNANDKEKINIWIKSILNVEYPELKSVDNQNKIKTAKDYITKAVNLFA
jgi:colicin import membrane protein